MSKTAPTRLPIPSQSVSVQHGHSGQVSDHGGGGGGGGGMRHEPGSGEDDASMHSQDVSRMDMHMAPSWAGGSQHGSNEDMGATTGNI